MEFSVILNWILGGGLLAAVVGVTTLKATVLKSNAEAERAKADAEKAKAEAESLRIDNAEHATRILMDNIVKPLKDEFNETKKELAETKKELARNTREMARFRKAVESANSCRYSADCPVLVKLRDIQKGEPGHVCVRDPDKPGQHAARVEGIKGRADSEVGGEPANPHGQSP